MAMTNERLCCCIPNQEKVDERCQKPAEFEIWYGWEPGPEDCTDSCGEHLTEMLNDSVRFEVVRITQTVPVLA